MSEVLKFVGAICKTCGLDFTMFGWPRWRVRGYCCAKCDPAEKKAAP